MAKDTAYFEGTVSMKRTFMWADRRLVIYSDKIEVSQPDKPSVPKTVFHIGNITLSPIIRHHGHFEFTLLSSESGYLRRLRLRAVGLNETERVQSIIQRVKMLYIPPVRALPKRDLSVEAGPGATGKSVNAHNDGSHNSNDQSGVQKQSGPHPSHPHFYHVYSNDNPHFSVNLVVLCLIGLATLIAPIVNSLLSTATIVLFVAVGSSWIMNHYAIDAPSLHLILTFAPSQYNLTQLGQEPPQSPGVAVREESHVTAHEIDVRRSQSFVQQTDVNLEDAERRSMSASSSINELGYSTPVLGSPSNKANVMSVLLSESSKFIANYASASDYKSCYSVMWSMSEAVLTLLQSQPDSMGPPADIRLVAPEGINIDHNVKIVPDDAEHTRSEWSVIRNKNGLRVLTSKLSSSLTRWPIISSVTTVKAAMDDVYRSVADPELYCRVDEFIGDNSIVDYSELASKPIGVDQSPFGSQRTDSDNSKPTGDMLRPETAPILVKYTEMKSVWPVQPRDYLALQSGFNVTTGLRKGKLLLAKSADPHPKDPYGDGHDGFVRGALTASAFLLLENAEDETATDVWTFLHCDMKGNLSGNGKIAEFITQSQMPKFLAKLETVASKAT